MGGGGETPCQDHTQERRGTDAHVDRSEPNQIDDRARANQQCGWNADQRVVHADGKRAAIRWPQPWLVLESPFGFARFRCA
jgi:hypothetical protein